MGPQTNPQYTTERITKKVESPRRRPRIAGSIRLPRTTLTVRYAAARATAVPGPSWISATSTAGTPARIDPTLGT